MPKILIILSTYMYIDDLFYILVALPTKEPDTAVLLWLPYTYIDVIHFKHFSTLYVMRDEKLKVIYTTVHKFQL